MYRILASGRAKILPANNDRVILTLQLFVCWSQMTNGNPRGEFYRDLRQTKPDYESFNVIDAYKEDEKPVEERGTVGIDSKDLYMPPWHAYPSLIPYTIGTCIDDLIKK